MRTDSNTILSLPSGVSPKKSSLAKVPSANGKAFANDFNKAKDTLSPSKASTPTASDSSAVASSSTASTSISKVAGSNVAPVNDKAKDAVLLSESSNSTSNVVAMETVSTEDSGKILHEGGEKTPLNGLRAEASAESVDLLSVTASSGIKSIDIQPSTSINSDSSAGQLAGGVLPVPQLKPTGDANATELNDVSAIALAAVSAAKLTDVDATKLNNLNVTELNNVSVELHSAPTDSALVSEMSDDTMVPVVSTGVVGLDAIKRMASNDASKLGSSSDLVAVSDSVEDNVELLSAEGEGKGELSWVLSQMGGSSVKAAPVSSAEGVVLDTAKTTAVTAGVLAGVVNRKGHSDVPPLTLSEGGLVTSNSDETSLDSLLGEDGVLIDEPIVLRKKEQDVMLGRMSAQIDGATADDVTTGGLSSSLNNNVNRSTAIAAAVANAPAANAQANLAMNLPPSHPGWASEMSQKVAWIARDGGHTAHIRLDPPELGSLTVKVSVDSDSNTQVSFVAATPQARDLLEGQMGRLREMLAQQGMDLSRADVDVSQQDTSGAQDRGNYRNNATNQGKVAGNDVDDELISNKMSYVSASGVDYYA